MKRREEIKMGRSIDKMFFGDSGNTNILVYFYKDGNAVQGFIVKQTGSNRFVCSNGGSTRETCYLVPKNSVDLGPGEMCISVDWDGNTYQVSRIQGHLVTINGGQVPWSFDSNLNPGTAQVQDFQSAPVLYLGTNSYITFGGSSSEYSDLAYDEPTLPKIMVGGADNSLQKMYYGVTGTAPNRMYVVRYQGTDSTSGDPDNPNMIIEYHFKEANNDQIEIHIVMNSGGMGDYSGVASANAELAAFPSVNAGDAYVWDDSAQTLTPIALDEYGNSGLDLIDFYNNIGGDYPYNDIDEDDGYAGFSIPWAITFNGTTWSA